LLDNYNFQSANLFKISLDSAQSSPKPERPTYSPRTPNSSVSCIFNYTFFRLFTLAIIQRGIVYAKNKIGTTAIMGS